MEKVSLVKSNNSYQGVQDSLKNIKSDLEKKIKNLEQIVIKINFVTTKVELATTPFEAVRGFIDFIRPFYKGKIVIAEEATVGDTMEGFERYGFSGLTKKDAKISVFDSRKDKTLKFRFGFLTIPVAKIYTKPIFVVSICRPKIHDEVVVTLSLKNLLVGAVQHGSFHNRFKIHLGRKLHQVLAEIAKYSYPSLAIIDGTIGMEGEGPTNGTPIKGGWVVASDNALAADSLATYLMGFDIDDIGYLTLLRDRGMGALYPKDKIEIIGEDPKKLRKPFKPHSTFSKQRIWR